MTDQDSVLVGETRPLTQTEAKTLFGWRAIFGGGAQHSSAYDRAEAWFEEGNYRLARRLYIGVAKEGHPGALHRMGAIYDFGRSVETDKAKALAFYAAAGDRGHAEALFDAARSYVHGDGVPVDMERARALYERSAERGWVDAKIDLAQCLWDGVGGPQDKDRAIELWEATAEAGVVASMLGLWEKLPEHAPSRQPNAFDWLRRAVASGSQLAARIFFEQQLAGNVANVTAQEMQVRLIEEAWVGRLPAAAILAKRKLNGDDGEPDQAAALAIAALAMVRYLDRGEMDLSDCLAAMQAAKRALGESALAMARRQVIDAAGPDGACIVSYAFRNLLQDQEESDAWDSLILETAGEVRRYVGHRRIIRPKASV